MKKYEDSELLAKGGQTVIETRNFVGKFVTELDFSYFPFDFQLLRIVSFVILDCVTFPNLLIVVTDCHRQLFQIVFKKSS